MGNVKQGVNKKTKFSVKAYAGDRKTMLAWDLPESRKSHLAGFTVEVCPKGKRPYYLLNKLRFEHPEQHAQDASEPAESTINSPFHKFRWVHVPGSMHQGLAPLMGEYTYVVTPRYFDVNNSMLALDPSESASVTIEVGDLASKKLGVAFTRGFVQSQAFVNHFGRDAKIRPDGEALLFDLNQVAGTNARGEKYTYEQQYEWLGFSARERVLEILDDVIKNKAQRVDVFAYDLDAPDVIARMITLAKQGRIRIILDNSTEHHNKDGTAAEDQFEKLFVKEKKDPAAIIRGRFSRFSHDKIFVVHDRQGALKVLTGSTNFSVTGLYVNSNHILVFEDRKVADRYATVFEAAWAAKANAKKFAASGLSTEPFVYSSSDTPRVEVTFAPHTEQVAQDILDSVVTRIEKEKKNGSVFFAVMQLTPGSGKVLPTIQKLHADPGVLSLGVSDQPGGVYLYKPSEPQGLLVSGKPGPTMLPPPFNQVPSPNKHQIHHKFVVCGFNSKDPVVYCGSSNLALGGEEENGDNLIAVHDADIATAFAIEAALLVDHFQFLDGLRKAKGNRRVHSSDPKAAAVAEWFLPARPLWAEVYYTSNDLHSRDRQLFG